MKGVFLVSVTVGLFASITFAKDSPPTQTQNRGLPLVYDPLTKKYFIGGSSRFLLKESDETTLIEKIELSVDGGPFHSYGDAIQFKEEGKHTLKFRASTPVNSWSPIQFVEVFVDLTSPATEIRFDEDQSHREATDTFVALNSKITLIAQDNMSGVANIEYSWDGKTFKDYRDPIVLDKMGKRTLYYRSVDRVGNAEPLKEVSLMVDGTTPNSTLKVVNKDKPVVINGQTFVSDATAFVIEATDDMSKVKQIWMSIDGGAQLPYIKPVYFLQEGPHTLKYHAVDNVGNRETEKTISVRTVSTPPHTTLTAVGKMVNTGGVNYATREFQIKLSATDNAVGLERIEVKLDDEQDFRAYIEPIHFKTPGLHTVSYRSVDRVGTQEPTRAFVVNVFENPPETTLATAQPLAQRGNVTYSPSPNVVTFNVSNSAVGVAQTWVSINNQPFKPYTGPLTLGNEEKVYKIAYKSTDKLGNEEPPKSLELHMISAVPIVDLFISNGQSSEERVRTNYLEQPATAAKAGPGSPEKPVSRVPAHKN